MGSILLIIPVLAPEPACAAVWGCLKCGEEEVAGRDVGPRGGSRSSRDGCFLGAFQGSETFSPGWDRLSAHGPREPGSAWAALPGITRTTSLCLGPVCPWGGGGGWSRPIAACTVPLRHPRPVNLFLPKSLLGHLERLLLWSLEVAASRKSLLPSQSQLSWWH